MIYQNVCIGLVAGCLIASSSAGAKPTYISIDVPGAVQTQAVAINQHGTIAGTYKTSGDERLSYLRATDGTFTTFQVPGVPDTSVQSLNDKGVAAGSYYDGKASHGFVRAAGGELTTFDPEGATNTLSAYINQKGVIAGIYQDVSSIHGYVRSASSKITEFDIPGAMNTRPSCINAKGYIVGTWQDSKTSHFFFKDPKGKIITFDPVQKAYGETACINDQNFVTGSTEHPNHGFIRSPDGSIALFSAGKFTEARALNRALVITGDYLTKGGFSHGFIGAIDGVFENFDFPKSSNTHPLDINDSGLVVGNYFDQDDGEHGFLRTP